MPRALSLDLRERVIAAGASCRQAAERFGVGAATAIRWQARFRTEGQVAAKPMGANPCSARIEAHAAAILAAVKQEIHSAGLFKLPEPPQALSEVQNSTKTIEHMFVWQITTRMKIGE